MMRAFGCSTLAVALVGGLCCTGRAATCSSTVTQAVASAIGPDGVFHATPELNAVWNDILSDHSVAQLIDRLLQREVNSERKAALRRFLALIGTHEAHAMLRQKLGNALRTDVAEGRQLVAILGDCGIYGYDALRSVAPASLALTKDANDASDFLAASRESSHGKAVTHAAAYEELSACCLSPQGESHSCAVALELLAVLSRRQPIGVCPFIWGERPVSVTIKRRQYIVSQSSQESGMSNESRLQISSTNALGPTYTLYNLSTIDRDALIRTFKALRQAHPSLYRGTCDIKGMSSQPFTINFTDDDGSK